MAKKWAAMETFEPARPDQTGPDPNSNFCEKSTTIETDHHIHPHHPSPFAPPTLLHPSPFQRPSRRLSLPSASTPDSASARPRFPLGCTPNLVIVGFSQKVRPIITQRCPPQLAWTRDSNPSRSCRSPLRRSSGRVDNSVFGLSFLYALSHPQITTASSQQPWLPTATPTRTTRPRPSPPRLAETRPARASCPRRRLAGTLSSNTTRP
jgi:hypothetical protein